MTRTPRFVRPRTISALVGALLLMTGPLAGGADARPALDREDYIQVYDRDVYFIEYSTLRNPTADIAPDEQLFNDAGVALPATWGAWSSATATAAARTVGKRTDVSLAFFGLIPGGVYSVFWGTLNPDSEHPDCHGVERTLPLLSDDGKKQLPDPSSFIAGSDGRATFTGQADAVLLNAYQSWYSIVYHLNGQTYHPFPNAGEYFTHDDGGLCRSTYGHDAMRQLIVVQKAQ
jgi:hypothetical protein